jgi:hypothetical protein
MPLRVTTGKAALASWHTPAGSKFTRTSKLRARSDSGSTARVPGWLAPTVSLVTSVGGLLRARSQISYAAGVYAITTWSAAARTEMCLRLPPCSTGQVTLAPVAMLTAVAAPAPSTKQSVVD